MSKKWFSLLAASALLLSSCSAPERGERHDQTTETGHTSIQVEKGEIATDTTEHVIYLAGGCFWGIEALMQSIPGVIDAQSGYANGTGQADADYRTVCTGKTGFRETVERIADIERSRSKEFLVEIGPLVNFYPAEEYHQDYLEKNPGGYCHIPREEMKLFSGLRIDPGDYRKPDAETVREKLTAEQYRVTQESAPLPMRSGIGLRRESMWMW